jgi:hypothetical protein
MDQLAAFDPYSLLALASGLMLTLCVAILFLMRDVRRTPPRLVRRSIWCDTRAAWATVDFIEQMNTGLVRRSVQRCSLLLPGERCGAQCRYLRPAGAPASVSHAA